MYIIPDNSLCLYAWKMKNTDRITMDHDYIWIDAGFLAPLLVFSAFPK